MTTWQNFVPFLAILIFTCVKFTDGNVQINSNLLNNFQTDQDERLFFEKDDKAAETEKHLQNLIVDDDVIQPGRGIQNVPWWNTFLMGLIMAFFRQREDSRSQFGVLFMANINNLNNFPYDFQPHNQAGMPVLDNRNAISPSSSSDFANYVSSRPENVAGTMIHAENRILNEMNALWNAYRNRYGQTPNFMILYSWIMPCPDCTNLIINHFNQQPYRNVQYRIVAYTVEGTNSGLPYMTPQGNQQSRDNLRNSSITVYRQRCNRPNVQNKDTDDEHMGAEIEDEAKDARDDPDTHVCKVDDTFQGCMVSCLSDICCSCKANRKRAMAVSFVNELTKFCATSDLETCPLSWMNRYFAGNQNSASSCTNVDAISSKVQNCAAISCFGRPMSKPLDPNNPYNFPGYLINFSDISVLPQVDLTDFCEDIRAESLLCTTYRKDSFTAGNTLCRSGSRCGYNGKSYSWCYVDFKNNWDYCCTGNCGFNNQNYMWCQSGNAWQYCGNAGSVTIGNQRCLAEFPCGVHQEDGKKTYFWCYTDTKYWNYCCSPWETCSKKGYSYNWCYTGFKKDSASQECTPS